MNIVYGGSNNKVLDLKEYKAPKVNITSGQIIFSNTHGITFGFINASCIIVNYPKSGWSAATGLNGGSPGYSGGVTHLSMLVKS